MSVKKSIFIQVQWYDPHELERHLEHIYQEHRDPNKDDYIYNVVLDEIGSAKGLSSNLWLIAPYLPGGRKQCFDNVFVGSHYMRWHGPGNAYREGIQDSAHRWRNLNMQKNLWKKVVHAYPNVPWHFYINHEGVLDYFDEPNIRNSYEAYLIQSARDAAEVKRGAALMWAPAIWSARALNWREESGIARVFKNVKLWSNTRGVTWLHFQDMQGRRYRPALRTVVQWYNELKRLNMFDSLRVDMELFRTMGDGTIVADTAYNVSKREKYYKRKGVPIGASWELRWWFQNHREA